MKYVFAPVLITFLLLPISVQAARSSNIPTIIPREAWKADETLGIQQEKSVTTQPSSLYSPTKREKECIESQRKYPKDFETARTEYKDAFNRNLRWSRRYSKKVKLIIIHHTGESNTSNLPNLPSHEQVRAIYKTHTVSNGWGDVGYHYLIDKKGVIYEGRAGGDKIVGAHVYCTNVGTIAIAIIGNFQSKYPSDAQLTSVRKLIAFLGKKYELNVNGRTIFQGKSTPTVITHRDIGNTLCAGRKVQKLMPKIRRLSASGNFTSALLLPQQRATERVRTTHTNTLTNTGNTRLRLSPRGTGIITLQYNSSAKSVRAGESIAKVEKSDRTMRLWQKQRGRNVQINQDLRADRTLLLGKTLNIQVTILAPRRIGTYQLMIGGVRYTVEVAGRW